MRVTRSANRVFFIFKRSCLLFLITGSLLFPVLHVISPSIDCRSEQAGSADLQSLSGRTFGPFAVRWFPPEDTGRSLKVAFDQLSVSKGSAGLFKTALFQTLHLTNLRLCTTIETIDPSAMASESDDKSVDPMHLSTRLFSSILCFQHDAAETLTWSVPDLGRAADMNVNGFSWQISDGSTALTVSSRLAMLDHQQPDELLLKGHVVLQSADRVIESNLVVYNMRARRFQIPGSCMLTVSHTRTFQRNISLDMSLNLDAPLAAEAKGENICWQNPSPSF